MLIFTEFYRISAALSFIVVIVVIGIPMWWQTTAVSRVSLPNSDILSLSDVPIKAAVTIGIYTLDSSRTNLLIDELNAEFYNNDIWILHFLALPHTSKTAEAKTPARLESMLMGSQAQNVGDFYFIEWHKLQEDVLLTTERTALIRSDTTASKIAAVLHDKVLQTHRIQQILSKDERYGIKMEAPQPEYDLIVSVINPRPDIMRAKWHVPTAVETYLKPFLQEVSDISKYTLKTQWKYNVAFDADMKQVRDSSKLGRHYALPESSLPHIISSIEKNLGAGISPKTAINIVVYLTPCDIAPLHIYNSKNERLTRQKVDAFISQKWGSFIFANPTEEVCLAYNENQEPVDYYVDTNDIMQIVLYHLQHIMDIATDTQSKNDGVETIGLEQIAPRRWEYEAYIRRSVIMHIETATNTLQSLIQLLDNISYIVINDKVGNQIIDSYKNILRAKTALAANQLLNALKYAKDAFATSERVFFDASLLAQLYFPDEQKYAIYIPLFLPIMVPVVTSLAMLRTFLLKWRNSKRDEDEKKTN